MRTKSLLLLTACALSVGGAGLLAMPGKALALTPGLNACGPVNTASNPQTATCTGAFNPYTSGIVYDENTVPVASQGNVQVDLSGTATVITVDTGVSVTGVSGLNATTQILTGASVTAGNIGVATQTSGGGTAAITSFGRVSASVVGLEATSFGGGLATITNNGTVTVIGAGAQYGVLASDGASITNTGTVTINGSGGPNAVSGFAPITTLVGQAGYALNTGTVSVTSGTGDATGIGSEATNYGSAQYINNGGLTVAAGTGSAYGFQLIGGTAVSITDAQTAAGTTSTSITGAGNLTGVAVSQVTGLVGVGFSGQALNLNATAGTATGVTISGGSGDAVSVAPATFGATTYGANMSVVGSSGATGVSIFSNSGLNAVSFTGASLTVNGGGSPGMGISVFGGSGAAVALTGSVIGSTAYGANISVTGFGANGVVVGSSGSSTVNLTGAALTATGGPGFAVGVVAQGGTSASVTAAAAVIGSTSFGADIGVTGTGAIGVAAGGAGANSVTLTGSALTVGGGTGSATGITLSGGTSATASVSATLIGSTGFGANIGVTGDVATGVTASSSGANNVTLTGSALNVNGGTGLATGINASGGSSSTVTVAATTLGSTTYGANLSATGVGAVGVSASGSGANAVSFTGAGLTANGGAGGATGISATGGTNGTVTLTAGASPAALSVSASGGIAEGVLIQGSGVLRGSFANGFLVTNTGGSATGLAMTGGTTQTATLSNGLTVSGAGANAVGLNLVGSGATVTTAHLLGPINVSSTGNNTVEGVFTANNAGVTIDGAPAITVSGGGFTLGVYDDLGTGPISLTTGTISSTSTTTSAPVVGIAAFTNSGAVTINDASSITVTSPGANYGVDATNGGPSGAINVTLNSVTLNGSTSTGAGYGVWVRNGTTGTDATVVTVQQVTTSGQDAVGVIGNASVGGAGTINLGSLVAGVHSGGVSTSGVNSGAVSFSGNNGLLTINNYGLVSTTGANSAGITGGSSGTGGVTVNSYHVTTAASTSPGVSVTTNGGAATVNSTSVATTGAASSGAIAVTTTGGSVLVNSGTATTTGTGSVAINTSSAGGATTINSTTATTANTNSGAIVATSTTGAIAISSATATTTGDHSNGIAAYTTTGSVLINSVTSTTTGAPANAAGVYVDSTSGAVTVNLADGGATTSAQGRGVYVITGGTSVINVGSSATTATVSGAIWGVDSEATAGTTLTIHGSVTGGGGAAINLSGGSDLVTNDGQINGYVTIASTGDIFTNNGTWNAYGANSTFDPAGPNVLNNTGTININPNSTTAATYTFLAPGTPLTINNSGTISLQQGAGGTPHTGDALNIVNAIYTGSGGAKLAIDANLGNAAVGASGAQTADELLVQTGSVAGTTTLVVRDLGAALPGVFNFTGIPVVLAGASSANAFVLQGGTIDKGYVQYQLTQSGANYYLVGLPSESAFEIGRTGAEAQDFWRRSGDTWADQMRSPGFNQLQGVTLWAQGSVASDTEKSRPLYSVVAAGNTFNFAPNLDINNSWSGAQFGFDYGVGHWGWGLTAGFGEQNGQFKADDNHLNLNGYNVGAYARWEQDGAFFNALAKVDSYTVKQENQTPNYAFNVDFDGSTVGVDLQAGYHWTQGASFIEPVIGLSYTQSSLNGFTNALAGASVNFNRTDSAFGTLGLRAGTAQRSGDWTVTPFAGAYVQGEMLGKNTVTVTAGPTALQFADPRSGTSGRFEVGVTAKSKPGLELSATVNGVTGSSTSGVTGRLGLAYHW